MKMKYFHSLFFLSLAIVFFPVTSLSAGDLFYRNLGMTDVGPDVQALQKILNSNASTTVSLTGRGSRGFETSYFGSATKVAVIKFQELYRNEILVPSGLVNGTGYVGTLTRKKLNSLSIPTVSVPFIFPSPPLQVPSAVDAPVITSLSTTTLQNGQTIGITGRNFSPINTVLFSIDFPDRYTNVIAASSTYMEVTFSSSVSSKLKENLSKLSPRIRDAILEKVSKSAEEKDGMHGNHVPVAISVKNEKGTSNAVTATINLLTGI